VARPTSFTTRSIGIWAPPRATNWRSSGKARTEPSARFRITA
jgi:hypothetical protein